MLPVLKGSPNVLVYVLTLRTNPEFNEMAKGEIDQYIDAAFISKVFAWLSYTLNLKPSTLSPKP